ncbi:MAG: hypothetical protein HZB32_08060 [Nitrospirae bacterium]|nr:hypothetical protein [Nitrospirota bacterium]
MSLYTDSNYLEGTARFEGQNSYRQTLGDLFQGIDSDFDGIKKVANWYKTTSEVLTQHIAPTFNINTFMTLPVEKIVWLASQSTEAEKHWHIVDKLLSRINTIFDETRTPASLDPGNATLDIIRDRLH